LVDLFSSKFIGIHGSRSGRDGGIGLHESSVLIALVFALSESRFPKLLKMGNQIGKRTIREDSGSLQAGVHRFDPGHVHQILFGPRSARKPLLATRVAIYIISREYLDTTPRVGREEK